MCKFLSALMTRQGDLICDPLAPAVWLTKDLNATIGEVVGNEVSVPGEKEN